MYTREAPITLVHAVHRDLEAVTEASLEVELGTDGAQAASGHDADAAAQRVRLFHAVRSDDNASVGLLGLNDLPDLPPCLRVQACRWFL